MQKIMSLREAAEYYRSMPDNSIDTKKFEYAASMLTAMLMGLGTIKGELTKIEKSIQYVQENESGKRAFGDILGLALSITATIHSTWDDDDKEKGDPKLWS